LFLRNCGLITTISGAQPMNRLQITLKSPAALL
jgi:hypothetical protein